MWAVFSLFFIIIGPTYVHTMMIKVLEIATHSKFLWEAVEYSYHLTSQCSMLHHFLQLLHSMTIGSISVQNRSSDFTDTAVFILTSGNMLSSPLLRHLHKSPHFFDHCSLHFSSTSIAMHQQL